MHSRADKTNKRALLSSRFVRKNSSNLNVLNWKPVWLKKLTFLQKNFYISVFVTSFYKKSYLLENLLKLSSVIVSMIPEQFSRSD